MSRLTDFFKSKKTDSAPITQKQALQEATRADTWVNFMTGMGSVFRDRRQSTQVNTPDIFTQQTLENFFAGDDLAKKICSLPPKNEFREWLKVQSDDTELNDLVQARVDELGLVAELIDARVQARLHGGSLLILGADDGQDPVQPLNEKVIKSLTWVRVVNRWEANPKRYYADQAAAKFGKPEIYQLQEASVPGAAGSGMLVHESRCLRFEGTLTTRYRKAMNNGWSDSIFVSIYNKLRAYGHIVDSSETLISDFAQAVYKFKGLAQAISAKGEDLIRARAEVINIMRSVLGIMVLDADGEEFERKATPMQGLPEMFDRFEAMVAAAADMPITVLFGRSPAGMNATGESDTRNWYDSIASDRRLYTAPQVERGVKLLTLSKDGPTGGKEPQDWRIVWNPLWQMSDTEKAGIRKTQAETDNIYLSNQVLDPREVTQSRFGGTEYSTETKLDASVREALETSIEEGLTAPEPAPATGPLQQEHVWESQEGGDDDTGTR